MFPMQIMVNGICKCGKNTHECDIINPNGKQIINGKVHYVTDLFQYIFPFDGGKYNSIIKVFDICDKKGNIVAKIIDNALKLINKFDDKYQQDDSYNVLNIITTTGYGSPSSEEEAYEPTMITQLKFFYKVAQHCPDAFFTCRNPKIYLTNPDVVKKNKVVKKE